MLNMNKVEDAARHKKGVVIKIHDETMHISEG